MLIGFLGGAYLSASVQWIVGLSNTAVDLQGVSLSEVSRNTWFVSHCASTYSLAQSEITLHTDYSLCLCVVCRTNPVFMFRMWLRVAPFSVTFATALCS